MSYRSTPENRHFGTNFMSIGGVQVEISMSPKWTSSDLFFGVLGHRYLGFYYTDMKLAPKYLLSGVLRYDIEFHLREGTEKKMKIKIYPPCFEKVFFRKTSLRGLQWCIFFLAYPLWCWRNKRLRMFWQGPHLKLFTI